MNEIIIFFVFCVLCWLCIKFITHDDWNNKKDSDDDDSDYELDSYNQDSKEDCREKTYYQNDDDSREETHYQNDDDSRWTGYQQRTFIHQIQYQNLTGYMPSTSELNSLASDMMRDLYRLNTDPRIKKDELRFDTVSVGVDRCAETMLVAVNIKERIYDTDTQKISYGTMGIKDSDLIVIQRCMNKHADYEWRVVTTSEVPATAQENAAAHAEMALVQYSRKNHVDMARVGTSKPNCKHCKRELDDLNIESSNLKRGNQKPKNWKKPSDIDTKTMARSIKEQNISFKWVFRHNVPLNQDQLHQALSRVAGFNKSFDCTITGASLFRLYDNYDRKEWVKAEKLFNQSGSYSSDRTDRQGACWRGGVLEASAGKSEFEVSASVLTASANAEYSLSGVSAGFTACLASVQIKAGPVEVSVGFKACTGVSIGIDHIEATFLGTGFRFGPKEIRLKMSALELKINPNGVIFALLCFIYHETKSGKFGGGSSGFGGDFSDLDPLLKAIYVLLGDKMPPPPDLSLIEIVYPARETPKAAYEVRNRVRSIERVQYERVRSTEPSVLSKFFKGIVEVLTPKQRECQYQYNYN